MAIITPDNFVGRSNSGAPGGDGAAWPESLEKLYLLGHKRSLHQHQELSGAHQEDQLIFIEAGSAKLLAGKQIVTFQFPGDIVSMLRPSGSDFKLVALTDLDCIIFTAAKLLDGSAEDIATGQHILTQALRSLHAGRTQMMQLQHQNANRRLVEFLVSVARRLGGGASAVCEFALPMSRGEIAESLGLTIETVSRQFTQLREAGLIMTQGRSIIRIGDMHALAAHPDSQQN